MVCAELRISEVDNCVVVPIYRIEDSLEMRYRWLFTIINLE